MKRQPKNGKGKSKPQRLRVERIQLYDRLAKCLLDLTDDTDRPAPNSAERVWEDKAEELLTEMEKRGADGALEEVISWIELLQE